MDKSKSINNLEEYLHPNVYEAEYGKYVADFPLFLGLKKSGKALDLACGAGRLTVPLSQSGLEVIGLDASLPMLEKAKEKSHNLAIKYVAGDIRDFNFCQKFDLVTMAGNSFQTLLTTKDQQKMLESARNHLKKNGLFIFDTRNPQPNDLVTTDTFDYWHKFTDKKGNIVQVSGKQLYEPENNIIHYITKRTWPDHETICNIKLRFTYCEDLCKALNECGFEIVEIYGDIDKSPYQKTSPSIIPVCKLK